MLEIGCGNGRDSLFFLSKGLKVTAIDASDVAIKNLSELELADAEFFCGKFFIEVRSVHDELFGKGECVGKNSFVHDGHFRRFIDKAELEKNLLDAGFTIKYSAEEKNFAPFGKDNPLVIRITAAKKI